MPGITYNTGTTFTTAGATASGSGTIPAGVLNGDVVFVLVEVFTTAAGTITPTLTSTATAPVQLGSTQRSTGAGISTNTSLFVIPATGSDAGATLTFGSTGGTGGAYWVDVGLVAYTGAMYPVDVSAGTEFFSASGQTGTTVTPSAVTGNNGDWQVQFIGAGPPSGNSFTVPGSLTQREAVGPAGNAGVLLEIADSNAGVGPAGTTIGNTTWTCGPSGGTVWSTSFTVGLTPAGITVQGSASFTGQGTFGGSPQFAETATFSGQGSFGGVPFVGTGVFGTASADDWLANTTAADNWLANSTAADDWLANTANE